MVLYAICAKHFFVDSQHLAGGIELICSIFTTNMVYIRLVDVPEYLRSGELFQSLNHDDPNECILVPDNCCKSDTSVTCLVSLECMLSTVRYWGIHELPDAVVKYLLTSQDDVLPVLESFDNDLRLFNCVVALREAEHVADQICIAVQYNQPKMLHYLVQNVESLPQDALVCAAEQGNICCLQILCEASARLPAALCNRICKISCAKGHIECLKYMYSLGTLLKGKYVEKAIRNDQVSCLEFLHSCGVNLEIADAVFAAQQNSPHCLPFVLDHSNAAATAGHLTCLQLAVEKGCVLSVTTLIAAARSGHLECVQFAVSRGLALGTAVCEAACRGGHVHCLQYAVEQGCPVSEQCALTAARYGHLKCLAYLHTTLGCALNEQVLHAAVAGGRLSCVKYVYNRVGMNGTEALAAKAAEASDAHCLQFLREQGCLWDISAPIQAAVHRSDQCLRYIYQQDEKLLKQAMASTNNPVLRMYMNGVVQFYEMVRKEVSKHVKQAKARGLW